MATCSIKLSSFLSAARRWLAARGARGSDSELQQPAARAPQHKLHAHGSREFGYIPPACGVEGVVALIDPTVNTRRLTPVRPCALDCNKLKAREGTMPASIAYTMSRSASAAIIGAWLAVSAAAPAYTNVITDWDEKAITAVAPLAGVVPPYMPYVAYRMMGMVHAAMFDAVNSIERRHQPYLVQLPADATTSKEAAARGGSYRTGDS